MPTRVLAALATLLLGFTLAACSAGAAGGDVASVNSDKITRADFDAKLESGPQARAIFNQLVQGLLIDQYATDNHIQIPDADVQKKEDDIKTKFPPGQWDQTLKAQGLSEDDVHKILRQQLIIQKAVGSTITVTPAQISDYLAKNHATLDTQEQVRARHILVPDLKTAELVESKLKSGAKFEDLAKQYSTDPSSKDKGGELGFFQKGQMVPAFQNAAFSQAINVVGPPVKSPFGFHIIETEEKKPAQVATVANSGPKIKDLLTQQQEQQQIPLFINNLRAKANIQIYDDRLKDALPPVPPAPAATAAASPAPAGTPAAGGSPGAAPTSH